MNNRLLHTPEGVRDIYGKEYARKLAVEQKLQNAIHCFGYEDYRKFIYIPKELHSKIHSLIKENNINPKENHWKYIVNLINSFEKYIYISV